MTWTWRLGMIVYFALGIAFSVWLPKVWCLLQIRKTQSWPEVEGMVVSVNVTDHGEGATAEVGYSYRVQSTSYGGFVRRDFLDAQTAWDFAHGCREMKLLIHYKPNRPHKSVVWQTTH
jgi:hypothetical protein